MRAPALWDRQVAQCARLGDQVVSDLLFVDDASLMATGAERAHTLLKLLNDFCDATGMKVNDTKGEVLIFGGSPAERRGLVANGFTLGGSRLFFLWKGLQVRRREGIGQGETKAQPAQASTSTTEDPNPVNPNRKRAHLEAKRT